MPEDAPPMPSWHARSGRLSERKRWALQELAARFSPSLPLRLPSRLDAVAVEIGAGSGEAALALATQRPDLLVIAAEVHKSSLAHLLLSLDESALDNVLVFAGDGRRLLEPAAGAAGTIAVLRAFFPDPWPKRRHHRRRLIDRSFVARAAGALIEGGVVELATDHVDYAAQARRAFAGDPRFERLTDASRAQRPITFYENRALSAGVAVHDLRFRRAAAHTTNEDSTPS